MKNLNKQFVPYEQTLQLVELGFDEECLAYYNKNGMLFFNKRRDGSGFYKTIKNGEIPPNWTCAVLWQQAFDFMLKKYYLYSVIIPTITMYWTFKTSTVVDGEIEVPPYKNVNATDYSTYEEARQACLEKLIELCGI